MKGHITQEQAMEELQRARQAGRAVDSIPSLDASLSCLLHVVTDSEALQMPSFWGFMEASLHSCDWLNHWPLVMDLTFNLSPLPEGQRVGLDSYNLPTHGWFPCRPARILGGFPNVTSLTQSGLKWVCYEEQDTFIPLGASLVLRR